MKMLTVDSCLCCRLETGGLIIGWLTLIGGVLASLSSIIMLVLLSIFSCEELNSNHDWTQQQLDYCISYKGVLVGTFAVFIFIFVGLAYIGWRCIQGTRTRDHFKVKPMLILLGVVTVLGVLQIFTFTAYGIVNGLIDTAINGYCFVVIYSLYNMFRQEYESGGNRHQQQLQQALKV